MDHGNDNQQLLNYWVKSEWGCLFLTFNSEKTLKLKEKKNGVNMMNFHRLFIIKICFLCFSIPCFSKN